MDRVSSLKPPALSIHMLISRCVGGRERWVSGGRVALADKSQLDTFLLGEAPDALSAADLRSARAAFPPGASFNRVPRIAPDCSHSHSDLDVCKHARMSDWSD